MTRDAQAAESLHDQAAGLLEAFALDALEPDEKAVVSSHLDEGCVDCEEEVSALRSVVEWLPLAAPLITLGGKLKRRVMIEVNDGSDPDRTPPQAPQRRRAGGHGSTR